MRALDEPALEELYSIVPHIRLTRTYLYLTAMEHGTWRASVSLGRRGPTFAGQLAVSATGYNMDNAALPTRLQGRKKGEVLCQKHLLLSLWPFSWKFSRWLPHVSPWQKLCHMSPLAGWNEFGNISIWMESDWPKVFWIISWNLGGVCFSWTHPIRLMLE